MRSILDLLKNPVTFPLELTLTTGQRLVIPHPDYTYVLPDTGELYVYGPQGRHRQDLIIDPSHIVKVRPKGRPLPL